MTKLKPCPFCGSEDIDCQNYCRGGNVWFVQCRECGATFPDFDSKEEAVGVWNKRHEPPTPGGAIVPAGNNRLRKPLKKCLQCNTVIEYNDIRLDDMGYSCCPHCQSNRLKTIYEVIDG